MASTRSGTEPSSVQAADGDFKSRRRSSRLTIDIPVEVISKGPQNTIRMEETRTFAVSAHGCGLTLKASLVPGETIVLIHKMSREEVVCRVVMCRQIPKTGDWDAGVEFQTPSPRFWHIAFPPDDWNPATRKRSAPPGPKK